MMSWLRGLFGTTEVGRWSVNCDFHNWTVHDLTLNEARVLVETLRDSERASVLVWKTGWPAWRELRDTDCSELLQVRTARNEAPPLPNSGDFDPEITAVQKLDPKKPFSSRKHTRFAVDYPVTLVSTNQEFHTKCVDISEGGVRVADELPDWLAGYSTAVIEVENGLKLEVMCSIAEDQQHRKTRLEFVPSDKQAAFISWFQSHPRFQGEGTSS